MKGWRTVLFNVVGVATMTATQFGEILPPKALPYIGLGIGVGNIILRTVTNTPVGQAEVPQNVSSTGDGRTQNDRRN